MGRKYRREFIKGFLFVYDGIDKQNGGRLVMAEGKDLLQVLWSGAEVLRGKMDANE